MTGTVANPNAEKFYPAASMAIISGSLPPGRQARPGDTAQDE